MANEKISSTASQAFIIKADGGIPYTAEIKASLGDLQPNNYLSHLPKEELEVFQELSIMMGPWMEARFRSLSEAVILCGSHNIIELAYGYSPRGLIMTEDPSVSYVASDLPGKIFQSETIQRRILRSLEEERHNLIFLPIDATDPHQLMDAVRLFPGNLTIICEGMLSYFYWDEKWKTIRENIYNVLYAKGGCFITSDIYTRKEICDGLTTEEILVANKHAHFSTGRSYSGCAFDDEEDIYDFFEEAGMNFTTIPRRELVKPEDMGTLANLKKNVDAKTWERARYLAQRHLIYVIRPKSYMPRSKNDH